MNQYNLEGRSHAHTYSLLDHSYDAREGFVKREKCIECDEIRIVVFNEEERQAQNQMVREMCVSFRDRRYYAT